MRSRALVAAVGVPLLLIVVLWAPTFFMAAALCALAAVGGLELSHCVGGEGQVPLSWMSAVFAALTVSWCYAQPEGVPGLFTLMTLVVMAYGIVRGGAVKFDQLAAVLLSGVFIAWSFASFLRMEAAGAARSYLLLPFLLSFACDTAAFFAGRTFGRHKLAPKVSPHKTVEGSVGGLVGNLIAGELFALCTGGGYLSMALLAVACGVVAQIGDLSFSLIKRQYGVKDYGRLFLEHGGVLDRFDSVLFVAPVVEVLLRLTGV